MNTITQMQLTQELLAMVVIAAEEVRRRRNG